ncbi:hypothetical protein NQZ79_g2283 [Umbelopsis isabellina]|nr:hypothetical protein NQZ79_g2283 [Umbelopsis isabellina]
MTSHYDFAIFERTYELAALLFPLNGDILILCHIKLSHFDRAPKAMSTVANPSSPATETDLQLIIKKEFQEFKKELLAEIHQENNHGKDIVADSVADSAWSSQTTSLGFTEGLMIGGLIAYFAFKTWR